MRILALDPGGTTGVAKYSTDEPQGFITSELAGDHHLDLLQLLQQEWWDVVIYERFQYQRRELDKGVSLVLVSVEYIGVIKLEHQRRNEECKELTPEWNEQAFGKGYIHPFKLVEQTPAQAKNLWSDEKLKKLGLWSSSPHERDATRHLLYYLVVQLGQREWIERLK